MRKLAAILATCVVCAISAPASAQQVYQKSFSPQLFEPAIGIRDTFLSVEGAATGDHLGFGFGLFLNYQHKPLVLYWETRPGEGVRDFDLTDAKETVLIENQMTADLYGALGLRFGWFKGQVGLALPVNLFLRGNDVDAQGGEAGEFSSTGIGDLRLQLKMMLFERLAGFSLAFSPIITIPTGCLASSGGLSGCDKDGELGGDSNLSVKPRVAADYRLGKMLIAANVGAIFRESAQVFSSEVGHRLTYGLAGGYQVHERVFAMAELAGQMGFGTKSDCSLDPATNRTVCESTSSTDLDSFPAEAMLGAHITLPADLQLTAGAGVGVIRAIGSPQFRVLAGLRWAPDLRDGDGDGVYDKNDKCPKVKEDKDGHQDADGCPDPDNDGDGIPDARDRCPDEKEDKDTFADEDGCPDPDNDKDGIPDLKDACPFKPETKNGYQDQDGCPDVPDHDADGVADADDKCPKQKEDRDGFKDKDGCPDPDNDDDGVPDSFDDCPNKPEDMDGFKDDDGCPDPDNDKDGVPDARDKCPNKPETINGVKDEDGCPDRGRAQVIIKEKKIVILKKVYFATGKSVIKKKSFSLLDQVALVLRANTQVKGVRIEGHTDSRGRAKRNRKLSQRRAEAVRTYLVELGAVDGKRLVAVGFGPDRPIASNRTRRGRSQNRRVEFSILDEIPGNKPPKKSEPKKAEPKKAEPKKAEAKKPEAKKPEAKKPEAKKPEAKKPEPKKAAPKTSEATKAALKKAAAGVVKETSKKKPAKAPAGVVKETSRKKPPQKSK